MILVWHFALHYQSILITVLLPAPKTLLSCSRLGIVTALLFATLLSHTNCSDVSIVASCCLLLRLLFSLLLAEAADFTTTTATAVDGGGGDDDDDDWRLLLQLAAVATI